jgi:S1-C subfamily serine protease
MVQGMVTVWVNRGIKLEKGMGYPDRVIGSGFFIDSRGYLLTNYHVIASEVDPEYEGYSRLYIRLSDKVEEKIPARVVGYDRIFDLALIKAEVEPSFTFSYGGSSDLKVGGRIIAIGSPAGLENTVTSGIVSATGRRFLQMGDAIQVDVPINYGNSGGPLLDDSGKLVGIVFAGIEQFEGVNFAIPFDWVEKALPRLYGGDEAGHPWLGIAMQESDKGLEVIYTVPGSPADRAGLKEGDILVSLNGASYTAIGDIQSALLDLDYPVLVTLEWRRGGQSFSGALGLAERPYSPIEESLANDLRENVLLPLFGMKIEKTGQFLWRTDYTVRRVLPGSIADETGLSKDDPLSIQGWELDQENRFALLRIYVKKRKSGFLESAVQLAAYLETDIFI